MGRNKNKDPMNQKRVTNSMNKKRKHKKSFFGKMAAVATLMIMGASDMLKTTPKSKPKLPKTKFDYARIAKAVVKRERKVERNKELADGGAFETTYHQQMKNQSRKALKKVAQEPVVGL